MFNLISSLLFLLILSSCSALQRKIERDASLEVKKVAKIDMNCDGDKLVTKVLSWNYGHGYKYPSKMQVGGCGKMNIYRKNLPYKKPRWLMEVEH